LEGLNCFENKLRFLNVKNGNNTAIDEFRVLGNPDLTCIQVDDVDYSTTNWTVMNPDKNFSTICTSDK
jgi:hypothetical protein